jgi:TonB family protein
MRKELTAALVVLLALTSIPARAQDPLAAAKGLYAAADYEGALKALEEVNGEVPPEVRLALEQYRALCLLAVGRKDDAEKAIEAVLDLDPFYEPREDDAAPWVRNAFREVRERVLPGTLQMLYGRAKQAFERKAYVEARDSFRQVLRVLDDPALPLDKAAQADMRLVVGGFLDLAEAAASAQAAAVPAPGGTQPNQGAKPPANPAAAPGTAKPAPETGTSGQDAIPEAEDTIYDANATEVIPPLPIRQTVELPDLVRPASEQAGVVEIVINRNGRVESVVIRQSFGEALDKFVQQAVNGWRYRAAMLSGKPVRYKRLVRIILPGRRGTQEPPL